MKKGSKTHIEKNYQRHIFGQFNTNFFIELKISMQLVYGEDQSILIN
jgi:hypothetical protein